MTSSVDFLKILKSSDENSSTLHDLLDSDNETFLSSLHETFLKLFTNKHMVNSFYNDITILLSFIESVIDMKPIFKILLKQAIHREIIHDIIICSEYKICNDYVIKILRSLNQDDMVLAAIIDSELYSISLNEEIPQPCRLGVKTIISQLNRIGKTLHPDSSSAKSSPSKTPTKDKANNFWGCIVNVTTQLGTVLDDYPMAELIVSPLSPQSFKVSFVPTNTAKKITNSKNCEELSEALDEIAGAYKALPVTKRNDVKGDVTITIRQLVQNLSSTNSLWIEPTIIVRCLLFMDTVVKDNYEIFLFESGKLLHQVEEYVLDERITIRSVAQKFLKSLILRASSLFTVDIVRSIYASDIDLTEEDLMRNIGLTFLLSFFSEQINLFPQLITRDDLFHRTYGAALSLILRRAVNYVNMRLPLDGAVTLNQLIGSQEMKNNLDIAIDTLSVGILLSLPISSSSNPYKEILSSVKSFSQLIAKNIHEGTESSDISTWTIEQSVEQEIIARAMQWRFPSITHDIEVMETLQSNHLMLFNLINQAAITVRKRSISTGATYVTPTKPSLSSSGSKSGSNVYKPSWTNSDDHQLSLPENSWETTLNKALMKEHDSDHENDASLKRNISNNSSPNDNASTLKDRNIYDRKLSDGNQNPPDLKDLQLFRNTTREDPANKEHETPIKESTEYPLNESSAVDASKLINLKRNNSTRRHSTRRAYTANDAVSGETDSVEANVRMSNTSDGTRRLSRDNTAIEVSNLTNSVNLGALIESENLSVASSAVSTRRSSRNVALKLRRRQRLFQSNSPGSAASSPYESENDSTDLDALTKSLQDDRLTIAQARLRLENVANQVKAESPSSSSSIMSGLASTLSSIEKSLDMYNTSLYGGNGNAKQTEKRSSLYLGRPKQSTIDHLVHDTDRPIQSLTRRIRASSLPGAPQLPQTMKPSDAPIESLSPSTPENGKMLKLAQLPPKSVSKQSQQGPKESGFEDGSRGIATRNLDDQIEEAIKKAALQAEKNGVDIKKGNVEYLSTEDVKPISNPSSELNRVLYVLDTENDWEKLFYTLNDMRSLALHHHHVIISSGKLHTVVLGILKQIENLRSAVAKNGILAMGDMYQGLGKAMEPEAALTIPVLVKRFGLSSTFLSDAAQLALMQMCKHISGNCALSSLLLGLDNRNGSIRGKVMGLINALFEIKGYDLVATKELDSFKPIMSKLYSDSSPEARSNCRNVIRLLVTKNILPKAELEALLSADVVRKCLDETSTTKPSRESFTKSVSLNISSTKPSLREKAVISVRVPKSSSQASGDVSDNLFQDISISKKGRNISNSQH